MVSTISRPHRNAFYLKYFVGSQLARFRSDWVHLKVKFYFKCNLSVTFSLKWGNIFKRMITCISNIASFPFTSKVCYQELLKDATTKPIVPISYSVSWGPGFDSNHVWPLVREPLCENI